jgi:hypothetical protein
MLIYTTHNSFQILLSIAQKKKLSLAMVGQFFILVRNFTSAKLKFKAIIFLEIILLKILEELFNGLTLSQYSLKIMLMRTIQLNFMEIILLAFLRK